MKKNLKSVLLWTLFPILMVVLTIVFRSVGNPPVIQLVAPILMLIIYSITKDLLFELKEYVNVGESKKLGKHHWQVTVFVAVAIWTYLIFSFGIKMNPWGIIGWTIFCSALILMVIAQTIKCYKNCGPRYLMSTNFYLMRLYEIAVIMTVAGLYLLWGTQYVWLPIVVLMTFAIYDEPEEGYKKKDFWPLLAPIATALLSTVIQFQDFFRMVGNAIGDFFVAIWNAVIDFFLALVEVLTIVKIFGLELWAVISIAIALFIAFKVFKRLKSKNDEATRTKIASENEKKQQEAKYAKLKMDKEEKIRKADELYEAIKTQEKISWKDLYNIYWDGDYHGRKKDLPLALILRTEFMEVVGVSKIKEQLFYEQGYVDFAAKYLNRVLEGSDDELIQRVIDQIKKLEEFKNYTGYEGLVNDRLNYRYHLIRNLVRLEVPEKKK